MFRLHSPYQPTGDQPRAIRELTELLGDGNSHQVLLGVTGSGKTFTVSNVIAAIRKPTLVISHNKTLAAQLYQEYRDFFPRNAVGYFVSYYDYFQPEAYIPKTDTYIEKETEVNDLIDQLRLQATTNLLTRKDVIIVASVSCIYNIGAPSEFERHVVRISAGDPLSQQKLLGQLVALQYRRGDAQFQRGTFRVRGDVVDLWPAHEVKSIRITCNDSTVKTVQWIDPISSQIDPDRQNAGSVMIYPAKQFITDSSTFTAAADQIKQDLRAQVDQFEKAGKIIEAHRLAQRVNFDLEMLEEVGYVNGVENYSRYFDGRNPGDPPYTLLDYFKQCDPDFLVIIDESHISVPQIRGMYQGDRSRKQTLIDYGFRLPAALDNRPLRFDEFLQRVPAVLYTSATPDEWEMNQAHRSARRANKTGVVEQLVRPTGLVDPQIEVRPVDTQVPDLVVEILKRASKNQRVLVTTLTKRTAEALTEYLSDKNKISEIINHISEETDLSDKYLSDKYDFLPLISDLPKVAYLHSDIATLDRQDILDRLRSGETDVLIGINLLREGLDLPEVSLVAILDADQEGFLRSKTSLIQTMGRASRHIDGTVILYAHHVTRSMEQAIAEVNRRREIQIAYNLKHNILPRGIVKPIRLKIVEQEVEVKDTELPKGISKRFGATRLRDLEIQSLPATDRKSLIRYLSKQMLVSADHLDFEEAAAIRDKINEINSK